MGGGEDTTVEPGGPGSNSQVSIGGGDLAGCKEKVVQ